LLITKHLKERYMKTRATITALALTAGVLMAGNSAFAQAANRATALNTLPAGVTVTDWYKQSVYDPSDAKIRAGPGNLHRAISGVSA
jgi:hypothetical protein